jgi:peptidoglycan/xylan/chitin deacetylase (PgdA/CDA1 family)
LGQRFPSDGIQVFRDKFRIDEDSQLRVRLQLDGRAEAYLSSVRGSGYKDPPGAPAAAETTSITRKLRVPILAYHSIADDGPPELRDWRITLADFQEQLQFLQQHGYRSISLEEWARCIAGKAPPVGRPVVITFDDGCADFLTEAAPRLEAAGFRATVFVVTGRVGAEADWDATSGPPLKLMSWDDLRALEARGFAIGSHMSAHRDLTLLSDNEIEEDGREALAALRRELGRVDGIG